MKAFDSDHIIIIRAVKSNNPRTHECEIWRSRKRRYAVETNREYDYIAYTDGGCARNPGGRGGYGVVLIECVTGKLEEHSCGYISTTNNRMEMMAALVALSHIPAGSTVHLFSDSQLLINCLSGRWEKKRNRDLWDAIEREAKGKRISLTWVKGHHGDPMNERCDILATEAMTHSVLLPDTGYIPEDVSGKQLSGKPEDRTEKKRSLSVPENLDILYGNPEHIMIHDECRKAIAGLTKDSSFHKLAAIKTGGADGWSRIRLTQIPHLFGEEVIHFVRSVFHEDEAFMNCMRWYGRGMTLSMAIRKVRTDEEVAVKMMRKQAER